MKCPDAQVQPIPSGLGPVVTPVVDESILATEDRTCAKPLPPIQPQGVNVSLTPQMIIRMHCNLGRQKLTFHSLDAWKFLATAIRTVLPPLFTFCIGYVLTVANFGYEITIDGKPRLKKLLNEAFKQGLPLVFCLPLNGIVFEEQSKHILPRIVEADIAKHTSLLLPTSSQVKSRNEAWYIGTNTTDTILRRSILPPLTKLPSCDVSETQSSNAFTSVAYEFMTNDWQAKILPTGMYPVKHSTVSGSDDLNATYTRAEAALFESLFARAVYLYVDGVLAQDAASNGTNTAALEQLKLKTIEYYKTKTISNDDKTDPNDHMKNYVQTYFDGNSEWSTLLHVDSSSYYAQYAAFTISPSIDFMSVTLHLSINPDIWRRELREENGVLVEDPTVLPTQEIVYEIDVANECGPSTCGIQNRGLAPEQRVMVYGYCPDDINCVTSTATDKFWVAGFGRSIGGESFQLSGSSLTNPKLRKAVLALPYEFHTVTMGLFSYRTESLSTKFHAECDSASISCMGISYELEPDDDRRQYLILGDAHLPTCEFGSSFDLPNNSPRGRPLLTRYTTGARVEYEILRPANSPSYEWTPLSGDSCSGKMDRTIISTELNQVYMEYPLQPTYTAGMFFLFQNARLVKSLSKDPESSLAFTGNTWTMDYALSVPFWQLLAGFIVGGVAVLACTLYVFTYHKRMSEMSTKWFEEPKLLNRVLGDEVNFPRMFFGLDYINPTTAQRKNLLHAAIRTIALVPRDPMDKVVVVDLASPPKEELATRIKA